MALWRTAWLLTGERQKAEDLVQEALTRCWSRFARLNSGGSSFEAYVRTTMVNTHRGWWRRGSWREITTPDEGHSARSVNQPSGHDIADLARALAELPTRQREVLVLRYFDDLTKGNGHNDMREWWSQGLPEEPDTRGWAEQAERSGRRRRRVKVGAWVGAACVVVLAVALGVTQLGPVRNDVAGPVTADPATSDSGGDSPSVPMSPTPSGSPSAQSPCPTNAEDFDRRSQTPDDRASLPSGARSLQWCTRPGDLFMFTARGLDHRRRRLDRHLQRPARGKARSSMHR